MSLLLFLLFRSHSLGEFSDFSVFNWSDSHDSCVDSAGNAILQFNEKFWQHKHIECLWISNISLRRSIYNVSHSVSFDGFIFAHQSMAVGASGWNGSSSVFLWSSVVSSLWRHQSRFNFFIKIWKLSIKWKSILTITQVFFKLVFDYANFEFLREELIFELVTLGLFK